MTNILNEILETYLADKEWQQYKQKRTETRNAALPKVTTIVHSFVSGATTLQTLCDQLNETFKNTGERWGAQGHSFMFPMYKIIKHHDEKAPVAETQLRKNVTDLNAENTGQRIEAFYDFLLAERTRLRQEGKPSGVAAEAGKSALIISLFAFWLHPERSAHANTRTVAHPAYPRGPASATSWSMRQ